MQICKIVDLLVVHLGLDPAPDNVHTSGSGIGPIGSGWSLFFSPKPGFVSTQCVQIRKIADLLAAQRGPAPALGYFLFKNLGIEF